MKAYKYKWIIFTPFLKISSLALLFSFFQKSVNYLKSVLSHGKSTPWNAMDQENSCYLCPILNDNFLSNRFQISTNWKCSITIFIENKYIKFPQCWEIRLLQTYEKILGIYTQSHRIGRRKQGWHFCSLLSATLFLSVSYLHYRYSTIFYFTILEKLQGTYKFSYFQLGNYFPLHWDLRSILENPDLSSQEGAYTFQKNQVRTISELLKSLSWITLLDFFLSVIAHANDSHF